jgi:hypothetical protein
MNWKEFVFDRHLRLRQRCAREQAIEAAPVRLVPVRRDPTEAPESFELDATARRERMSAPRNDHDGILDERARRELLIEVLNRLYRDDYVDPAGAE